MAKELLIKMFEWSPSTLIDQFHTHEYLEVGYCLSGKGKFHFGSKTYSVTKGDVFIVNNLEPHAASSDIENPSNYLFLYFDPMIIEQVDPDLLMPFVYFPHKFNNRICGRRPSAEKIGELFLDIWREQANLALGHKGMIRSKLLEICVLIQRHYGVLSSQVERNRALAVFVQMKPGLDFINMNFSSPITLEHIADVLSLSSSRTRHLFVERFGCGFKQYLLHVRVNEAKRLLVSTDLPIFEVLHQAGFQSSAAFYRTFKQLVGDSPQGYRLKSAKIALFKNDQPESERN